MGCALISTAQGRRYKFVEVNFEIKEQDSSDQFEVSILKFYIGQPKLFLQGEKVHSSQEYFLVDMKNHQLKTKFKVKKKLVFDSISFDLGVDSTYNVSGVLEGALNPSKRHVLELAKRLHQF